MFNQWWIDNLEIMMTFLHKSSDDQGKEQWSGIKTIDICNNLKYPQFCRSNISGLHTQTNVSGLPIMHCIMGSIICKSWTVIKLKKSKSAIWWEWIIFPPTCVNFLREAAIKVDLGGGQVQRPRDFWSGELSSVHWRLVSVYLCLFF